MACYAMEQYWLLNITTAAGVIIDLIKPFFDVDLFCRHVVGAMHGCCLLSCSQLELKFISLTKTKHVTKLLYKASKKML